MRLEELIKKIKITLWQCGLTKEYHCPVCNNKLTGHGYSEWTGKSPGYYTCPDEKCYFNHNQLTNKGEDI